MLELSNKDIKQLLKLYSMYSTAREKNWASTDMEIQMLTQIELTGMKTSMCTIKKHTACNNSTSFLQQKKEK